MTTYESHPVRMHPWTADGKANTSEVQKPLVADLASELLGILPYVLDTKPFFK